MVHMQAQACESCRSFEQALTSLIDIQLLIVMHFFAKLGYAANEAATGLKMIEKGFKREELAVAVLIDFPFQIMGGWLAAKWSRGDRPLRPWLWAFWPRMFFGFIAILIVYWFPKPPISTSFFVFLVIHTVFSSFASYVFCTVEFSTLILSQNCSIRWHFRFPYKSFRPTHWRHLHDGMMGVHH